MAKWRNMGLWAILLAATPALHAQSHSLTEPAKAGDCFKYEIAMTLKGELRVSRDGKTTALPISANANHAFVERVLQAKEKGLPEKVARYYGLARSVANVDGHAQARSLRDERKLIVAQRHKEQFLAYSPAGPMTREEVDVASEHFDTLALTGLLPEKDVNVGDSWKLSNEAVQSLCIFEALISHDLTAKLEEIKDGFAAIVIGGKSSGIDAGAMVKLTISAKAKYEILAKRIVHLEWTQKDERDQGPVSPAGTVETTTILKRSPIEQPEQLNDSALEGVPRGFEPPAAMTMVHHADQMNRYDVATNRDWRLVAQTDLHIVLRLVDRGELISQASLTPWTKADPGKHASPDDFKQAMAAAPGWQLEDILEAGEIPADNGRWIYRISARGVMDDVKVVQTFYLIANAQGEQVVATFTMKPGQVAKLGSRDLSLIGTIGFPKK